MLTLGNIFTAQRKYGATVTVSDSEKVTYEVYLSTCRRLLADKTPADYFDWDRKRQLEFTDNLIVQFVKNNQKDVEGYVTEDGDLLTDEIIDRLRADITDYGILRDAMENPEVQEIQINDFKTIWVVIGGKAQLYVDKNGKPYQFVSDIELHSTINRLIYNPNGASPRMTITNPLINTRTTAKGYRLSGVNNSAITPDMKVGYDFPVTSITIRKYSPSRLTFDDFIKFDTLTPKMADFLRLCGRANIRLACVGPTSSGKTTLLNAIVYEIPRDNRLLLIQNPTEIMVYERSDETGANLRNAVHWEASEVDAKYKDDPTTPTMSNFIAHALRNTPDVIIPGEVRTPEEFFEMNRALKTGHRVLTTFHATDGADAVERMANELATLGGSVTDYLSSITHSIDIIVSQLKLDDGSRHVMRIEELTGSIDESNKAETRILFQYTLTGKVDKDEITGKVKKIYGRFEQVNPISNRLLQKFYEAGMSKEELEPFLTIKKEDKPEEYVSQVSKANSYKADTLDANAVDEIINSIRGSQKRAEHFSQSPDLSDILGTVQPSASQSGMFEDSQLNLSKTNDFDGFMDYTAQEDDYSNEYINYSQSDYVQEGYSNSEYSNIEDGFTESDLKNLFDDEEE